MAAGEPLPAALVTAHLKFSLPYRALFTQVLRPDTATRLVDALAALLVRLHNVGFFWGDVSLSNTLFRRDAGAFAAYLVDAETGELHSPSRAASASTTSTSRGRTSRARSWTSRLVACSEDGVDAVDTADAGRRSATTPVGELTMPRRSTAASAGGWTHGSGGSTSSGSTWISAITTDIDGTTVQIQPKVVDAGHHSRRLLRLTGLDVEENQARRLLNDLDAYRAATDRQGDDEEIVAHDWLARVFQPIVRAVPRELAGKLDPAEVFHEVLEHRWYLSEEDEHDVSLTDAVRDYLENVLPLKPDEETILGIDTAEPPSSPTDPTFLGRQDRVWPSGPGVRWMPGRRFSGFHRQTRVRRPRRAGR